MKRTMPFVTVYLLLGRIRLRAIVSYDGRNFHGVQKNVRTQDGTELRTALKRVGAIRVDALQAVEVLWTPQEEGDTLSEDELLRDYPQLNVL